MQYGTDKSRKQKLKYGDEWDVFTGWRKLLCYTKRAGVCKRTKRKANRRFRREFRKELRFWMMDLLQQFFVVEKGLG